MSNRDELANLIKSEYIRAIDRKRPQDCWDAPADAIISVGYRKPRIITEGVIYVDTLPMQSVIQTKQGCTMEKLTGGWYRAGVMYAYTPNPKWLPATVLYEPEAAA